MNVILTKKWCQSGNPNTHEIMLEATQKFDKFNFGLNIEIMDVSYDI